MTNHIRMTTAASTQIRETRHFRSNGFGLSDTAAQAYRIASRKIESAFEDLARDIADLLAYHLELGRMPSNDDALARWATEYRTLQGAYARCTATAVYLRLPKKFN